MSGLCCSDECREFDRGVLNRNLARCSYIQLVGTLIKTEGVCISGNKIRTNRSQLSYCSSRQQHQHDFMSHWYMNSFTSIPHAILYVYVKHIFVNVSPHCKIFAANILCNLSLQRNKVCIAFFLIIFNATCHVCVLQLRAIILRSYHCILTYVPICMSERCIYCKQSCVCSLPITLLS